MKKFLITIFTFLAFPTFISSAKISAAEINCNSPVWKNKEICSPEDEYKGKIKEDVNIKGENRNFVFNEIINSKEPPNTEIFYDREFVGSGCNLFGKCLSTGGVVAKWSNYFVELQPYEISTTFKTIGSAKSLINPPKMIYLKINNNFEEITMTNWEKNQYYLPLNLRKEIVNSETELSIEMSGVKMPVYKVGAKARPMINNILNTKDELTQFAQQKSFIPTKASKLKELNELYDSGLINEKEYSTARQKILNQ